uniref:Uncharacterized protein n=1 Tax=Meloidogyne enterolobii TaxID=390850 RepID=A0A6V7UIY4_MELEN|nr:unnamed protein product [Meloidogyne enterolobii]
MRTPTNEVKKGCGKCPFHTCEECNEHLCNNQDNFYCFGFMGSNKKCKKSDCYVAKIEEKNGDEKIEQFHHDCGKCPSGILDLSPYIKTKDTTLANKIKKINMSNVQCAHCNNKPACNVDTFFESQLFCWEKELKQWTATKAKRVCRKGLCFVGTNKREMGKLEVKVFVGYL